MLEIRQQADGRFVLEGPLMVYGDTASIYGQAERFLPGSIRFREGAMLNLQHDRAQALARYPNGGLELIDSPTEARLVANLPATAAARDTYELVRAGVLTGLSVEFAAERERLQAGERVIERALVLGAGVVDEPAYKLSRIEARGSAEHLVETYAPRRRRFFL